MCCLLLLCLAYGSLLGRWPHLLPACLLSLPAELLVDLPLAYFVAPISLTPGQLPLVLDFEQKR